MGSRRTALAGSLAVLAAMALADAASANIAAIGPPITNDAVSKLGKERATVSADINPEGSETSYELELRWREACAKKGCKPKERSRIAGSGTLPAVNEVRSVSVAVKKLEPKTSYVAVFSATNSGGSDLQEERDGAHFKTK